MFSFSSPELNLQQYPKNNIDCDDCINDEGKRRKFPLSDQLYVDESG